MRPQPSYPLDPSMSLFFRPINPSTMLHNLACTPGFGSPQHNLIGARWILDFKSEVVKCSVMVESSDLG